MAIRIITDSGSDIVEQINGVTVLPLSITFGEETFRDGVDLTHHEFYEKLQNSALLPTTSQAPPYLFEQAYKEAIDAGETVIVITLSSKLSGTYQSAVIAAADYPNQVLVVDSLQSAWLPCRQ